jgi:hypothetical protein
METTNPFGRRGRCQGVPMRCPYCGSVVEPMSDAQGTLVCPACQNTGQTFAAQPNWAPVAPATANWEPQAPPPPLAPQRQGDMRTPGKVVAALVLGIAGVVLFPIGLILGTLAIIYAVKGRKELQNSPTGTPGDGMATAGLVLGIVGLVVGLVGGVVVMSAVVFVLVSNLGEGSQPPEIAFDRDGEGPGGTLTVATVDPFVSWDDLVVSGSASCSAPSEGLVEVGDRVVCEVDGRVEVRHWLSGDVVYSTFL